MKVKTIVIDTEKFAKTYKKTYKKTSKSDDYSSKTDRRKALAEANNCIAIGDNSAYAAMVAVPKDYPDVVIKICDDPRDAFIHYAQYIFDGTIKSKYYPVIHSIAEISKNVFLIVMERLAHSANPGKYIAEEECYENQEYYDRYENIFSDIRYNYENIAAFSLKNKYNPVKVTQEQINVSKALVDIERAFQKNNERFSMDLHKGNIMFRANGDVVLLDPVC